MVNHYFLVRFFGRALGRCFIQSWINKVRLLVFSLVLCGLMGCSSAKKKNEEIFTELDGKKIALASIEGDDSAKKIVEVAVINQLVKKGSFTLISKQDFEAARRAPEQDPEDLEAAARKAGAGYALFIKVLEFDAKIREGYSEEEVIDTQLAAETGTDGKTQQILRVKSLDGRVKYELRFVNLITEDVKSGIAEAQKVERDSTQKGQFICPLLCDF